MAKRRLYEIARELNTNNSEILWVAKKLQIDVKNHMSGVSDLDEKRIRKFVQDAFRKYEELQKQKKAILEKKRQEAEEKARLQAEEEARQKKGTEAETEPAPEPVAKPPEAPEEPVAAAVPEPPAAPAEPVAPVPPPAETPKKAAKKKPEHRKTRGAAPGDAAAKEQARKAGRRRTGAGADRGAPLSGRTRQWRKDRRDRKGGKRESMPPVVITSVTVGEEITVKDLAMKISKTASELITKLMKMGVMVTINQSIDFDTAALLLDEYGITAEFKSNKRITEIVSPVDEALEKHRRPPIITVMGHVDHGKTSLLDAIRKTRVTEGEAGGITQHIGAYQVEHLGEKMTFIDTPGHEAFTSMRARGARVTDIAILVVAADDGVMPQTIEAISHARAAKVPILVAVNKIDKPGANPDRVMQQLTEHELVSEAWGGETIFCNVSAVTGEGIQNLLEMLLLISEMLELKAATDRLAEGFVIEAQLDRGRGPVATLLVREGTLHNGDVVVTGQCIGRVRAMTNEFGVPLQEAPPSAPVEVIGLSSVPQAGDIFQCVSDEKYGKEIVEQRCIVNKEEVVSRTRKITLEDIFKNMEEGDKKELFLILKGDVQGSVEALSQSLLNLNTEEVRVSVVHSGVGAITETDVMLAAASDAIIIGFNVRPDANAKKAAAHEEVDVRLYRIIYEAIDDVKAAMSGLLEPELREAELGVAEIRDTFKVPKIGVIAGCYVTSGKIPNNAKVRIVRNGVIVFEGSLSSLKRFKDDVKEVAAGYECGMGFERFNDVKEGDVVEAYTIEKLTRTL